MVGYTSEADAENESVDGLVFRQETEAYRKREDRSYGNLIRPWLGLDVRFLGMRGHFARSESEKGMEWISG